MDRRRFLAAAEAVDVLPDPDDTSVDILDDGSAIVDRPTDGSHRQQPMRDVRAALDLGGMADDDSKIGVTGYRHEEGVGGVEMDVITDMGRFLVVVSPERAREMAEDIEAAAEHASRED